MVFNTYLKTLYNQESNSSSQDNMDFKEILFLTYSSIKERKTRNALTILMIMMGCGLLVSLNSLSQGLIYFVEQNFKKILPNQIVISNTDKIQGSKYRWDTEQTTSAFRPKYDLSWKKYSL